MNSSRFCEGPGLLAQGIPSPSMANTLILMTFGWSPSQRRQVGLPCGLAARMFMERSLDAWLNLAVAGITSGP